MVADPDGTVGGCEHRSGIVGAQAFSTGEGKNLGNPEAIQAGGRDDPDIVLPIFVDGVDHVARKTVGAAEIVDSSAPNHTESLTHGADPKGAGAIVQQIIDLQRTTVQAVLSE